MQREIPSHSKAPLVHMGRTPLSAMVNFKGGMLSADPTVPVVAAHPS